MSEKKDYNGWANYETWAVNLWLNNDAGLYDRYRQIARHTLARATKDTNVKSGIWSVEEAARYNLADMLKDEVEEGAPDLGASLYSDLIGAALDKVNWEEIAESFLNGVRDE